MPTYFSSPEFRRMFAALDPAKRALFKEAMHKLVEDLAAGSIRPSLRVKRVQGKNGVWEMSWARNGRATFQYGPEVRPGHPHVIWLRIGGHEIFD
jgi:hypothetical protein